MLARAPLRVAQNHAFIYLRISARPFAAAGHELEPGPGTGRLHVCGIEGAGG